MRLVTQLWKKSVAVYSAGDKNASYLKHADEAVCIGGAKSSESYLNIPALITAAEMTEEEYNFLRLDILSGLKAERFLGLSGNPLNISTG